MRKEQIGDATLYLGDCLEIMPTLQPVGHIISDPPYEELMQNLHRRVSLRRTDGGPGRRALGFKSIAEIREPFLDAVKSLNTGWLLAFCNVEGVWHWRKAITDRDLKFKTTCIWHKPDATPKLNGQGPALAYECITTTWCGRGHSRWNGGGKRGVFSHCTNARTRHGEHPTEKPVDLMCELVSLFSDPDQTVLDPFMGSGTTGVACAKLGRKFIGIELEEKYFEIACKRIDEAYRQADLFIPAPRKPAKPITLFDKDEF